ncbi:YitT family protein [Aneurinibacillus danicus]|uniref:Membrane protein n=1 Tax=Aneurinibacillus danicus TaxID=267746 RepID=A0A511V202_9BACL|nr:YitT family protein [Aneurinibacillus danicus]GEN32925.1 membrane protein [Aneurinibacillus danicus]
MENNDTPLKHFYYKEPKNKRTIWKRVFFIGLGAFLAAFGLEMFLTPNRIITGGVNGISGILSHITEMQMGVFLFFINLPFAFNHGKRINRSRALLAVLGLFLLSAVTILLHPFPPLIEDPPLAAFFGSLILGSGIGLIFRHSGFTDGVQQAAILIKKRVFLSISEIVTLFNLFILTIAGFIFGWDQAVYSIFGYVITMKSAEYTISKFYLQKVVWIKTEHVKGIKHAMKSTFGTECQYLSPDFPECKPDEIYMVIPGRLEKKIQNLVFELDPSATFICTPLEPYLHEEIGNSRFT